MRRACYSRFAPSSALHATCGGVAAVAALLAQYPVSCFCALAALPVVVPNFVLFGSPRRFGLFVERRLCPSSVYYVLC
jgi:hypothetical protein